MNTIGSWGAFDASTTFLFSERPLHDRPAAAAAAGFSSIESWWPFTQAVPSDGDVSRFIESVGDAGVKLVALNFFAGNTDDGDRGLVSLPDRRNELFESAEVAATIGRELGVTRFTALYGNRREGFSPGMQDDTAIDTLCYLVDTVAPFGATVQIEPLSGAPDYPLRRAQDVVAVLDRLKAETRREAGLLLDSFHLAANGDDPVAAARHFGERITHVQLADYPGRHEPGMGGIDFADLFRALSAHHYSGWLGLEYRPAASTEVGLQRVASLLASAAATGTGTHRRQPAAQGQ